MRGLYIKFFKNQVQIKETYCRGTIVPVWEEVEASKFGSEIDDKVRMLAQHTGITGKNTLEKMKKLNKTITKGKGYQEDWEKEIYRIKDQIILQEAERVGKLIKDKGNATMMHIRQGSIQVNWHLGDFRKTLKKLWRIKKQE